MVHVNCVHLFCAWMHCWSFAWFICMSSSKSLDALSLSLSLSLSVSLSLCLCLSFSVSLSLSLYFSLSASFASLPCATQRDARLAGRTCCVKNWIFYLITNLITKQTWYNTWTLDNDTTQRGRWKNKASLALSRTCAQILTKKQKRGWPSNKASLALSRPCAQNMRTLTTMSSIWYVEVTQPASDEFQMPCASPISKPAIEETWMIVPANNATKSCITVLS